MNKKVFATVVLVFGIIFLTSGLIRANNSPTLEIPSTVIVKDKPLTLDKVTSNDLNDPWASLDLGRLPSPGSSRTISKALIVMKAHSNDLPQLEFNQGVSRIKIKRPGRELSGEKLKNRVVDYVEKNITGDNGASIEVLRAPESVKTLPGPYNLKIGEESPYGSSSQGGWKTFHVYQSGEKTTKFRAEVKITNSVEVPVAKMPISRGSKIEKSMIRWEKKDLTELRGQPLRSPSSLIGLESTKRFRTGEVILGSDLAEPILVDRRDKVTILYQFNRLTIRTSGEAQEEGAKGDRIKVENISTEKEITARIINERTVQVNHGNS